MIKNLKANKTLWLFIAGLSLIAASIGVLNQNIYIKVIKSDLLPGTVAQDVITIIASLLLLFLIARINEADVKKTDRGHESACLFVVWLWHLCYRANIQPSLHSVYDDSGPLLLVNCIWFSAY